MVIAAVLTAAELTGIFSMRTSAMAAYTQRGMRGELKEI
jgi:hypothetical protein